MMSKMDPAYGTGLLKRQIRLTYALLSEYRQKYEVRSFNMPHIGRMKLPRFRGVFVGLFITVPW
jgi:hypothetical protein